MSSKPNTLINLYEGMTQTPLLKKVKKWFSRDLCRVSSSFKMIWDLIHYLPAGISSKVKAMPAIACINPYLHPGCIQPCPNSAPHSCWCHSAYWVILTPCWEFTIPFDLSNRNRLREGDSGQQFLQFSLRRFACCTWTRLSDIWQHLWHIPISCSWLMP